MEVTDYLDQEAWLEGEARQNVHCQTYVRFLNLSKVRRSDHELEKGTNCIKTPGGQLELAPTILQQFIIGEIDSSG